MSSAAPTPCTARAAISTARVRGEPAQRRRHREPHDAPSEHLAAPVLSPRVPPTSSSPASVSVYAVDHPLDAGHGGVEVAPDGRQRDAHNRRVERGHRRPEHGGDHHPPPLRAREAQARGTLRSRCLGHLRYGHHRSFGIYKTFKLVRTCGGGTVLSHHRVRWLAFRHRFPARAGAGGQDRAAQDQDERHADRGVQVLAEDQSTPSATATAGLT